MTLGRWVAKLVAHLLATNPDTSQKYKMGDISIGAANTLKPAKKKYEFDISNGQLLFFSAIFVPYYSFSNVELIYFLNFIYSLVICRLHNTCIRTKNGGLAAQWRLFWNRGKTP